ncbi:MAG TPA: deoxyribonuclease IV, partial [Arachnia sp.]|nr:deoxyribonuclease IV [Arachnia sp.]
MTIRLGSHVDSIDPLIDAVVLGAEVVQIFLGDPQSWKAPACLVDGGAPTLRAAVEQTGLGIVVHAPYALNVASPNNRIRIPSRKLLQQTVTEAAAAGALGVVVHGGHVTAKDDAAVGYANWRKCVDGLDLPVPIFIENTAGGNSAMTRHLESIDRLWDALSGSPNIGQVGFCLDTCHAHAAGLGLDGLVDRVKAITGRIDVVHCNDSRDVENSGADRHANLGEGFADADA